MSSKDVLILKSGEKKIKVGVGQKRPYARRLGLELGLF